METNPNLKIAAQLLKEIAKNATDATAFKVQDDIEPNRIYLFPDEERRSSRGSSYPVFYHSEQVVDICRALGLNFWIEAQRDGDRATFEVDIF